ncbi:matrixin family metalloprotease [Thalassobaculum salexigens]|uniref:matrixin family metalloprotease n=1 Tax=Thalassobaculum salexigens TaxID=455360 RepID=UPI00248DB9FF|nr:matrixin family metalloprotease [Thalassobaculum salexigens]
MSITPLYDTDGNGIATATVSFDYGFTEAQKESIYTALDTWEALTNVDFSTHSAGAENQVAFTAGSIDNVFGIWAYAYYWGEVVYDVSDMNRIEPEIFTTLSIHEVGHIVGLEHQTSDSVMISAIRSAASAPTDLDIANLEEIYGPKITGLAATVQAGGDGVQEVVGNAGADILYGNQAGDTLLGRNGDDTLYGGQDDDTLIAGNGDDQLFGNLGNDLVSGGLGDDLMVGGGGADLFIVGSGQDTISDFSAAEGDRLSGVMLRATDAIDGVTLWLDDGTVKLIGLTSNDVDMIFV